MPGVRGLASHEREESPPAVRDVQARRADRVDGKNREDKNPEVVEVRDEHREKMTRLPSSRDYLKMKTMEI
jgi:hypothetical protein